ncbi:hypothetical protein [Phocaeicola salanitronis]|uniref:hypothetical protein n=1 Tax=Phocaeicola salanitronis TaxID=376805 RepID=UPI0023F8AB23|nr:hypothetical protein [Phocaeicola salanitronis]
MAAGDIILENGGTVTASDIQQIAAAVKSQLASESKDLSQYENVETLSGVSSLPGFMESGATKKLVRVALSVLKGVDGKTPEITSDGQAIKWRYTGETQWNTLVQLSLLKGDKGEDGEKVQLRKGDTGIEWKYEDEEAWNTLVPMADLSFTYDELTDEQKQEISKKPILSEVSATAGDTASGSFSPDGTDEQGNPKYVLNLVSPRGEKGETGKTPILQKGTITTLEPTEEATFELVQSGTDGSGNPIYKMNLGLPKGNPGDGSGNPIYKMNLGLPKGNPGDGSGNVYVDPSGLTGGKQYVFQPTSAGSATGTFHPIENATDESNGLMSKEEHSKLGAMKEVIRFPKEIFNLTDASETEDIRSAFGMNHMNIYSMFINICSFWDIDGGEEYAKKCYIGNYECLLGYEYKGTSPTKCTLHFIINDKGKIRDIAVSSFIEDSNYVLTCKVTESGGGADDTYWLPTEVYNLKSGATKEEILTAIGDTTALQNALNNGKKIYIKGPVLLSIVNIPVSISFLSNIFQISFPYVLNTNSYAAEKIIQVSANDGYVKLIYFGGYEVKPEVYSLTSSSSSEDISTSVGGESGLKEIIQAIKDGNRLVIRGTNESLGGMVVNQDLMCNCYEESENGDINLMISGIGYGLFGGIAGFLAISYTKSSNTFSCSYSSIS